MRIYLSLYFLVLVLALFACADTGEPVTKETEPSSARAENLPVLLQEALTAHGGLDIWDTYQSLEFTMQSMRGGDTSEMSTTVDLKNRREQIVAENYKMGYDGKQFWYYADSIAENYPDPKFYINLQFYFFGMPFVAADPGTNYEEMGQRLLDGKTYDVLKLTYGDEVGQSPEDQYLLYVDSETHQLHLLLYSVTYFNEENAEKYNALLYQEWQTVDGLQVPLRAVSYSWDKEAQALGEERGVKVFSLVDFDEAELMDVAFDAPQGAVTQ